MSSPSAGSAGLLLRLVLLSVLAGVLYATAARARALLAAARRALSDPAARDALAHWALEVAVVAVTAVSFYGALWKHAYLPAPLDAVGREVALAVDAWIWKWNLGYVYCAGSAQRMSRRSASFGPSRPTLGIFWTLLKKKP